MFRLLPTLTDMHREGFSMINWIKNIFRPPAQPALEDAVKQYADANREAIEKDIETLPRRMPFGAPPYGVCLFFSTHEEATEVRKDKARLDWLERHTLHGAFIWPETGETRKWDRSKDPRDFRSIIDAAM